MEEEEQLKRPTGLSSIYPIITSALLLIFGYFGYDSYRVSVKSGIQYSEIERLKGVILHYDEVLTISAIMAATSGDLKWEKRYLLFEPKLDSAIQKAIKMVPESHKGKTATQTDKANTALVKMEKNSFSLIRKGNYSEAKNILSSDEYKKQKKIYVKGIDEFALLLTNLSKKNMMANKKKFAISMSLSAIVILIIFFGWFLFIKTIGKWHILLSNSNKKIRENSIKVNGINQTLDDDVKERTLELEKSRAAALNMMEDAERSKREMEKTTHRMKSIQEALDSAAIVSEADIKGTVTFVNDKFIELSQYSKDELIGKNHRIVKSDHHTKEFFKEMWKKISRGSVWSGDIKNRAKDGTFYWVKSTIYPIKNSDGIVEKFIAIRFDITGRKNIEEEIVKAKNKAEVGVKTKSEFLANMSHEIRTPMNGVLGMLTLLEDTKLNKEQEELVRTIRTCGNGLLTIINDILDFSKIEANKLELEKHPFDLNKCINNSVYLLDHKASQKRIQLSYSIDNGVPDGLLGDETRVRQILVNLLSNAVKFTKKGDVSLSVFAVSKGENFYELNFSVKDSGIGISKEDQSKLFQSFSQVDTSITRKYGGTGLGLSICHKLSELMDGKMWVESEEGQGATFYFKVVLKSAELEEIETEQDTLGFDSKMGKKWPLKILVVEDNDINQKLAVRLLEKMSYHADIAGNGVEAIESLDRQHYDLVFMDMQMPVLDGVSATEKIVKKWGDKKPRIIAMTANVLPEDRKKCIDAGMDDFISKPVAINALTAALSRSAKLNSTQGLVHSEHYEDSIELANKTLSLKEAEKSINSDLPILNIGKIERNFRSLFDVYIEAASIFISNYPKMLKQIEKSISDNDKKELEIAAHTIKGTLGSLFAEEASMCASSLEEMGRQDILQNAPRVFEILETNIANLIPEIEKLIKNKPDWEKGVA